MVSHYPNGFNNGVTIRGMSLLNSYGGNIYWVDSASAVDDGSGKFTTPFTTVEKATTKCAANNGDIVMIKPGHSETFSAAASSTVGWEASVAGVTYIGLGNGTDRPKFILDTAATTDINVSAAGVTFHNLVFEAGFADIAKMIHLTAGWFTLSSCKFQEQVATENWVLVIDADGTTDEEISGLKIIDCEIIGADTANENVIKIAADSTSFVMDNNYVELGVLDDDAIIEVLTGKDLRSCRITNNNFHRLNTDGELLINVDTGTANTGICANNYFGCLDTTGVVLIQTTTRIMHFENYVTGVADESGYLDPAAGADA